MGVLDSVCLVMPCYNERGRLRLDQIQSLIADCRVSLVLVDDGSTDGTLGILRSVDASSSKVKVLALDFNCGKGEAVRRGLIAAMASDPSWVGFLDADMATPAREVLRLLDVAANRPSADVILGSRVMLLGRDINRFSFRHYTGRVFATFASIVLSKPVYDTQCGAKLFRRTHELARAIERPFRSRWAFDVELLGRLADAGVDPSKFWEEPLLVWHDIAGSRRTLRASIRASAELFPIWREMRGRRRWE